MTKRTALPTLAPLTGSSATPSLATLTMAERSAIGGLSEPGKMPWFAYSISAWRCGIGSRLADVPGSTCHKCYARGGNYSRHNVRAAQERRYHLLADDPQGWASAMAGAITGRAARFWPSPADQWPAFRWHDAGDIQGAWHLSAIVAVAAQTQSVLLADGSVDDVRHWLPTRETGMVREWLATPGNSIPRNLTIRLSAHMVNGPAPSSEFGRGRRKVSLPVSTVHSHPSAYPDASVCPAYQQEGKCGSCRACWDGSIPHVSYPLH